MLSLGVGQSLVGGRFVPGIASLYNPVMILNAHSYDDAIDDELVLLSAGCLLLSLGEPRSKAADFLLLI